MKINSKRILALISISIMVFSVFISLAGSINAVEETTENSKTVISGFVTDEETSEALWEVEVVFYSYYKEDLPEEPAADSGDKIDVPPPEDDYEYLTFTDDKGFYKLEVPTSAGELSFYLKGYDDSVQRLELKTSTLWLNVTLREIPPPPEPDAVLKGVATDEDTGEPIPDVIISLYLNVYAKPDEPDVPRDETGGNGGTDDGEKADSSNTETMDYQTYWFEAITSAKGDYQVELYSGRYWLSAYMEFSTFEESGAEYYPYSAEIDVNKNTTTYYNFTMKALPPRDAFISGYITNSKTGKAVENMGISVYKIYSSDENGFDATETGGPDVPREKGGYNDIWYGDDSAYGSTDSDGFFRLNLRAGTYMVYTNEIYYYGGDPGFAVDGGAIRTDDAEVDEGTRGGESSASSSAEEPAIMPGYEDDYYPRDEYYPFSATVVVDSKETVWLNISLKPIPPKNSKVTGKVLDAETGKALPNAYINMVGYTQGYQNYYWAFTDSNGEYEIQVREGFYVMSINYYYSNYDNYDKEEYYKETDGSGSSNEKPVADTDSDSGSSDSTEPASNEPVPPPRAESKQYFPYTGSFTVGESTSVKHDAKLVPYPVEDSTLHGKITDMDTGEALPNVYMRVLIDYKGHEYSKYTYTDFDGVYTVDVPASTVTLIIDSYYSKYNDRYYYEEEENADNTVKEDKGTTETPPPVPPEEKPASHSYFGFKTVIDIDANEDMTYNIQLEQIPERTSTLKGTLTDSSGSPVMYGWVALIDFEHFSSQYSMYAAQAWTDEQGEYTMEIYPGSFGLVADASWLLGVDGTETHFEEITIDTTDSSKTKDIKLQDAENNKLELTYKFNSWQEVDFTAKLTLNENAFGFRYYMDRQFGNDDGTVDIDELTDYVESWLIPQGFAPFGQLSVDSVTYHPKPGNDPTLYGLSGDEEGVKSTDPLVFTIGMKLIPYKKISEKHAEHEVELNLNTYLPAEVTYDIELPSGSTVTGFSDSSGDNTVSGVGEDNVIINSPFDNTEWYNDYGERAYDDNSGESFDASSDPGILVGAPEPPKANDGAEGGNNDGTYSQTLSDGSGTIRLTVTSPVIADDSDASALSGTQKVAAVSGVIIAILLVVIMMMVSKKRRRPKRPDTDERIPAPSEDPRKPPTRPAQPNPLTPPTPPIQK
jgi:hypothetical protein